jgi:hypothetical protein
VEQGLGAGAKRKPILEAKERVEEWHQAEAKGEVLELLPLRLPLPVALRVVEALAQRVRRAEAVVALPLALALAAVEGLREEGQGRYSALQGLAVALGQQVLQCQGEEAGRELRGGLSAGLKAMFQ